MKHYDYKTVIFVQISEMSSPTAQCTVKLTYRRLSGDGSVATPSFSLASFLATMVRF